MLLQRYVETNSKHISTQCPTNTKENELNRSEGIYEILNIAISKKTGVELAVASYGNLAKFKNGAMSKTAGVDEAILKFKGSAVLFESPRQESNLRVFCGGASLKEGDYSSSRYEGSEGGHWMQEMTLLYIVL